MTNIEKNKLLANNQFRILIRVIKETDSCDTNYISYLRTICKTVNTSLYDILTLSSCFHNEKIKELWGAIFLTCASNKLCDVILSCKQNSRKKINYVHEIIDEYNRQHKTSFGYEDGITKIIIKEYYNGNSLIYSIINFFDIGIQWQKSKMKFDFYDELFNDYLYKLTKINLL